MLPGWLDQWDINWQSPRQTCLEMWAVAVVNVCWLFGAMDCGEGIQRWENHKRMTFPHPAWPVTPQLVNHRKVMSDLGKLSSTIKNSNTFPFSVCHAPKYTRLVTLQGATSTAAPAESKSRDWWLCWSTTYPLSILSGGKSNTEENPPYRFYSLEWPEIKGKGTAYMAHFGEVRHLQLQLPLLTLLLSTLGNRIKTRVEHNS